MRYCTYNGCQERISSGWYCEDHKRKKKVGYQSRNKSFYRSSEWQTMRQYIYERDRGCCGECKKFVFGKQAHIHHKISIRKDYSKRLDENNLVLLCDACHKVIENKTDGKPRKVKTYFQNF